MIESLSTSSVISNLVPAGVCEAALLVGIIHIMHSRVLSSGLKGRNGRVVAVMSEKNRSDAIVLPAAPVLETERLILRE